MQPRTENEDKAEPSVGTEFDPVTEIRETVRDLYERGATQRVIDRMLGIEAEKVGHWAMLHDWIPGEKRLFRFKEIDLFEDGILNDENHPGHTINRCCHALLEQGMSINEIYHETGVKEKVLAPLFGLKNLATVPRKARLDSIIETKLEALLAKIDLDETDLETIERLSIVHYRFMRAYSGGATNVKRNGKKPEMDGSGDAKASPKNSEGKSDKKAIVKKQPRRKANDISHITVELLDEIRDKMLYLYQHLWYDNKHQRNRFILKSRQIGATWYFAWEALDDAIRTGDNQLFISASRDQAEVFKQYIAAFAMKYFEVDIRGKFCAVLSNGAELRFLATNSATAQSYHGHLYIDEVFWIPKFKQLKKVADGMAAHKKWRKTYFSTPSAMSHDAYPLWSGSEFASNHKISDFEIDTSHPALKGGLLGPDNIWRHMITVEDAQEQGCDLFDIAELKLDYSENDYANQFGCKFIDDSQSVFSLQALMNCVVDADDWSDYKPNMERPFANRSVAFGFDPSRTRDNASLAILEIPPNYSKPFRVLALHSYHGQNVQRQAGQIKELVDKHTVRHLGVDTTGIGSGVFDLVRDFYPMATPIHYSTAMKNSLVVKMLDLIANGRFKYLSSQHEITRAFMMITQTTTATGQIVYASSRSPNAGHADVAWALMHAAIAEDINVNRRPTQVTFSD